MGKFEHEYLLLALQQDHLYDKILTVAIII